MPALWRRIDPAGKATRERAGRGPGRPPKPGKKASTFVSILYIVPDTRSDTISRKERNI